jgi:hypothetical protein
VTDSYNWMCPFCRHHTTLRDEDFKTSFDTLYFEPETRVKYGQVAFAYLAILCPNEECKELTITARLSESITANPRNTEGKRFHFWSLLPESNAKPQPDYIPEGIREDYTEACRIRELSPKASATLSRRCLQGMIRHFWNIQRPRLNDEINELKGKIPSALWDAIDSLRHVGNIGAHMDKDVNVVVDVEPEEAEQLIGLIDVLFEQWYVKKHDEEAQIARVAALKGIKQQQTVAAQQQAASQQQPTPPASKTTP